MGGIVVFSVVFTLSLIYDMFFENEIECNRQKKQEKEQMIKIMNKLKYYDGI